MSTDLTRLHGALEPYLTTLEVGPSGENYLPGTRGLNWDTGAPIRCLPWDHERMLQEFFEATPAPQLDPAANVLLLIGGIGTGKSTTIRYVLHRVSRSSRACRRAPSGTVCAHPPRVVLLDFIHELDASNQSSRSTSTTEEWEEFWKIVGVATQGACGAAMAVHDEVAGFWPWSLQHVPLLANCKSLHRLLTALRGEIGALALGVPFRGLGREELLTLLLRERNAIVSKLDSKEFAWYHLLLLRYIADAAPSGCRCVVLVLDNVDHLHPKLQIEAVRFGLKASEVLESRTLIAVRPLTFSRGHHGAFLLRTELQKSPDAFRVIRDRVKSYYIHNEPDVGVRRALDSLMDVMTRRGKDRLPPRLIPATSGLSLRYALRNFENMLQSPHLAAVPDGGLATMRLSELCRAYFFGNVGSMISWSFENLYKVGKQISDTSLLIKPRVLDYVLRVRGGVCRTHEVFSMLSAFGYAAELVSSAISELLIRTRPLLWSEDGFDCNDPQSQARMMITPIGRGYADELFGEVFYDEVCLASSESEWLDLREVYEFHKRLVAVDLAESTRAMEIEGTAFYCLIFPADHRSISVIHSRRLIRAMRKRVRMEDPFFDPERDEWIARQIEDVIIARDR